jgi:O-antigen/teichoic acid export membrane protein
MTTLLNAVGRPDLALRVQAAALALPTLLLWPLSGLGGEGIAIAFTVGQLGAVSLALACSRKYWTPDLVRQLGAPALAGGGALLAVYGLQAILPQPLSGWTELFAYGAFCSVGLVAADRRVRGLVGMLLQHVSQLTAVAVVPEPVRPSLDATSGGGGHSIVDRVHRDEVR